MSTATLIRPEAQTDRHVADLERRSTRLRAEAEQMHPVLAAAYRRRASELDLEVWARRVAAGERPQLDAAA